LRDGDGWVLALLAAAIFAIGCVTGWMAKRDDVRHQSCAAICTPRPGQFVDGKCYCAVEPEVRDGR
jgi:hypothetical protein